MTVAARFKQEDIARAMKGARKAGYTRVRVGIDVAGNIVVEASDDPAPAAESVAANPLDRILPRR
ncbi:hypothetical protein SAMN05192583_0861 [Sphingomonas gellani]|uniref:Uncharacterized protein n=1 Tax=Sphingomonas gellani TaxID=1166340 RepID=A0A1H7ZWM2_9SPHN|nr:hypothetical protein SAMN05192583_0861 [Sphingomonas gellani]